MYFKLVIVLRVYQDVCFHSFLFIDFCCDDDEKNLRKFFETKVLFLPRISPDGPQLTLVPLAGTVEYTDCISAEEVRPSPNECPRYDPKQSDAEVPVMIELWGMRSTPSLPLLPGSLWPRVVVPDNVLSMGQIELNSVLMLN